MMLTSTLPIPFIRSLFHSNLEELNAAGEVGATSLVADMLADESLLYWPFFFFAYFVAFIAFAKAHFGEMGGPQYAAGWHSALVPTGSAG
jgi:hypothetical protein